LQLFIVVTPLVAEEMENQKAKGNVSPLNRPSACLNADSNLCIPDFEKKKSVGFLHYGNLKIHT
jgi:hypothetical protein